MTGRPWKPSRRARRVLLALLSGAPNLSGYPIGRAAQVSSGGVYVTLARLERMGWVAATVETAGITGDRAPRRLYHLTPEGRSGALAALGLTEREGEGGLMADKPHVLIDGTRYVPVSSAHIHARDLGDAVVSQWAGDNWRTDYPDAPSYLRVIVTDEDGGGETVESFLARLIGALP